MGIEYNEFGIEDFDLDLSFPEKLPVMTIIGATRNSLSERLYEDHDSRAMKVVWGIVSALGKATCTPILTGYPSPGSGSTSHEGH